MDSFTSIRMRNDWALIKRIPDPEITQGGIYIPASEREAPQMGYVISTGPGKLHRKSNTRVQPEFIVSDIVLFPKFEGLPITLNFEPHLIIKHKHLLLVIRDLVIQ